MSIEVSKLANGVTVAVDPIAEFESAAVGVWVKAGARAETRGEAGLAHLLEHMAFKGTQTRSALDIAEAIEQVGGALNAATGYERTGYYARVLSADAPLAIELIADILMHSAFEREELAREQEVVVQEIGEAADTPDDLVYENLQRAVWGDTPLGRPILGDEASVRAHTPEKLRAFCDALYRPEDMIVAAAGGVEGDTVRACAERFLGGLAPGRKARPETRPRFLNGEARAERALEQSHFAMAAPGYGMRDDEIYAARVLAEILGGGMSSRLFQSVREQRGLAYTVYAYLDAYSDCGLLGVYAGADPERLAELSSVVADEFKALCDAGVSAQETMRAKAQIKANFVMSQESAAARAEAAAAQIAVFGAPISLKESLERIDAVDEARVSACARAIAGSGQLATSVVGPNPDAVERERVAQRLSG